MSLSTWTLLLGALVLTVGSSSVCTLVALAVCITFEPGMAEVQPVPNSQFLVTTEVVQVIHSTFSARDLTAARYIMMSDEASTNDSAAKMQSDAMERPVDPKCKKFVEDDAEEPRRFYSPNYPNHYWNHTDCVKIIKTEPQYQIKLEFIEQFELEESADCKYDYLEVVDGAHGFETSFGKFCGVTYPRQIISKSNYLYLRFHSDDSIEGAGFVAMYEFLPAQNLPPKECRMVAGGDEGVISNTDIDEARVDMTKEKNLSLECMWIITVRQNWKVQLNFTEFKLTKPNDCKHNFLDVFANNTELSSRKSHFCGTTADPVTSDNNVIHIRFFVDREGITSNFSVTYTAYHDKDKSTKNCADDEFDCQDDKCIMKTLQCNGRQNCRFGGDEECQTSSDSMASRLSKFHIVIILVVFCLILCGMIFTCLYHCVRKLVHDHRVIREHIRESRAGHLDEIGKEHGACPVSGTRTHSESSGVESRLSSHRMPRMDPDPASDRDSSPQPSGTATEECYVPGAGDIIPLFGASRIKSSETRSPPAPINGNAVFLHESESLRHQGTPFDEDCDDLGMSSIPVPEMRDNECQTRESLFMNTSSDRSMTPPPPPPPATTRFTGSHGSSGSSHRHLPPRQFPPHHHSSSNTSAFSTFGYTQRTEENSGNSQGREIPSMKDFSSLPPRQHHHHHHHHHHGDQHRFKAEAVIEMKPAETDTSRPFSIDSTKSAPDVIVTH